MRLNSNPLLRPTLNTFNVKFTIHSAGWRGGHDAMSNTTSHLDTKQTNKKKKKEKKKRRRKTRAINKYKIFTKEKDVQSANGIVTI